MKYRRYVLWISHKARVRQTDGQTDGQNNDSQDRASIAASRGNNNHLGTVSVHFTRASVFMIYNGSEFAGYSVYTVVSSSFFLLSSFLFPRLISVVADWMSAILPHMVWPYCEFKMQV